MLCYLWRGIPQKNITEVPRVEMSCYIVPATCLE